MNQIAQKADSTVSEKHHQPGGSSLALLCLTALGVVYGDIGTSPLYAMRECFYGAHAVPVSPENILGVLSLIFWSLIIIVTVKYHVYILRADNRGEGGIMALMALVTRGEKKARLHFLLIALGLFGGALLYGDGIITPAISVLSAVEGLQIATPFFKPYVIPITVAIIIGLFLFQKKGTHRVGVIFGPITLLWFFTLAMLGLINLLKEPSVLKSVNPIHAVDFFARNGLSGFLVLGAVFLVATGGEALYADLGHFGEKPIQIDWFSMVAPSLLLNYWGQGALLLRNPEAAHNPFYLLAPSWALYPLVFLATLATIIASQAIISGVFSLTRQAVQLGYAPRVDIIHTSTKEIGQIYIPGANWLLMIATIWLVISFKTSSNLAAAYGVAVTSTMMITTLLAYFVTRHIWKWPMWLSLVVTIAFFAVDAAFFGANAVKIAQGGWVPLLIGSLIYLMFTTWKRGREILYARLQDAVLPLSQFIDDVKKTNITRVSGTAVFLNSDPFGTPIAMLHNIKHNKILHQRNIILTIVNEEIPHITKNERAKVEQLGEEFYRVILRYGFMEDPDVPSALKSLEDQGLNIEPGAATYILSRNTLKASKGPGMALWREKLFTFMTRNASRPTEFFKLPANRVIELGMQIEI